MGKKEHFRVCHKCGTVNCAEEDLVTCCEGCGKHLAPFYFFDESRAMGMTESTFYSSLNGGKNRESILPHKEYPPIWGLTVYWES